MITSSLLSSPSSRTINPSFFVFLELVSFSDLVSFLSSRPAKVLLFSFLEVGGNFSACICAIAKTRTDSKAIPRSRTKVVSLVVAPENGSTARPLSRPISMLVAVTSSAVPSNSPEDLASPMTPPKVDMNREKTRDCLATIKPLIRFRKTRTSALDRASLSTPIRSSSAIATERTQACLNFSSSFGRLFRRGSPAILLSWRNSSMMALTLSFPHDKIPTKAGDIDDSPPDASFSSRPR
mmetsp:Transcript_20505/g.44622  ORF Transcript_20505/g.44622 Transcript_20505/m.44622 type:complete len:238 (-) Transcript_20505:324-1037(-)